MMGVVVVTRWDCDNDTHVQQLKLMDLIVVLSLGEDGMC